jgi:hypothetical protein
MWPIHVLAAKSDKLVDKLPFNKWSTAFRTPIQCEVNSLKRVWPAAVSR